MSGVTAAKDGLAFDYEDLWYIEIRGEGDKRPKEKWGGYSQDFEAADCVYSYDEVRESDETNWAIVGIRDRAHTRRSVLTFDIDIHKAPEEFNPSDISVPESWPLTRTQSGGLHTSVVVLQPRGTAKESDFEMTNDLGFDIDIRGSFVSHHTVAPADIPGVGGPYKLVRDRRIPGWTPEEAAAAIKYKGEPLLEYKPERFEGDGATVSVERAEDAPDDMPTCYARALAAREADGRPEGYKNDHEVNRHAAILGAYAGYSADEQVTHFKQHPPNGNPAAFDADMTRRAIEGTIQKIDADDLAPVSVTTLRKVGLFDGEETCDADCPIHGSDEAGDEKEANVEPEAALALKRLEFLDAGQRGRYRRALPADLTARTTDEVSALIHDEVETTLRDEDYAVIQAPTGSNKTGVAAETIWRNVDEEITGDRPVVLFSETCDARDEAVERARAAGLEVKVLKGYKELCPVARGEYDPANIDDEDPDASEPLVFDGQPAGEWFTEQVERKGVPISVAHTEAEEKARRQGRELPCCEGDYTCRTKTQWPEDGLINEERIRCRVASQTADECEECGPVRCAVADHTVDECLDCHTERGHCDEAGAEGHSVDECSACYTENVRCERHDPEHTVNDCPDCFDARCEYHDPDHTVDDCSDCTTESHPRYDLVVATDPFAFVPSLRTETNVIHDEQPEYTEDFGLDAPDETTITARVRDAVTAFLGLSDEGPDTYEELVELARGCARCDAAPWNEQAHPEERPDEDLGQRWIQTFAALEYEPERRWYLDDPRAHTLAPALAEAIWEAIAGDVDPETDPDEHGAGVFDRNGRSTATVSHAPPRLDEDARDDEGWNRTLVTVTIDDENTIRGVRNAPDFSTARSVVGLDARPTLWLWQRNVHPDMTRERVLDPDEARLWRRYERGQTVVQVGNATRPAGSEGKYFTERHARALIERFREYFDDEFRAAGTAKAIEADLAAIMLETGGAIDDLETMHYGEEKSRNDFADETTGLVYGCIDPGDDYVLDLLAECGLEAEPERSLDPCDDCGGDGCYSCDGEGHKRAHGRGFVGPNADHAEELLESVRATHVAQMIGRFGRDLDVENGETNLTFVATDAVPADLVDYQVPGVEWLATPLDRDILTALRDRPRATTRELAEEVGCSKEKIRQTLARLEKRGITERQRGRREHGADAWLGGTGTIDDVQLRLDEIAKPAVRCSSTVFLAIIDPHTREAGNATAEGPAISPDSTVARGDPPPNEAD